MPADGNGAVHAPAKRHVSAHGCPHVRSPLLGRARDQLDLGALVAKRNAPHWSTLAPALCIVHCVGTSPHMHMRHGRGMSTSQRHGQRTLDDRSADLPGAGVSLPLASGAQAQSHCTGSGWKNAAMQASTLTPCSASSTTMAAASSSASSESRPWSVVPLRSTVRRHMHAGSTYPCRRAVQSDSASPPPRSRSSSSPARPRCLARRACLMAFDFDCGNACTASCFRDNSHTCALEACLSVRGWCAAGGFGGFGGFDAIGAGAWSSPLALGTARLSEVKGSSVHDRRPQALHTTVEQSCPVNSGAVDC